MKIEVGKRYRTNNGSLIEIYEDINPDGLKGRIIEGGINGDDYGRYGWTVGTGGWQWQKASGEFSGYGVDKPDFPLNIIAEAPTQKWKKKSAVYPYGGWEKAS